MAIIDKGKLLYNGQPSEAIAQMQGLVWEKSTTNEELEFLVQEVDIISKKLVEGKPLIHAYAEEHPGYDFYLVEPSLEDVFFTHILQKGKARSVQM